MALPQWTADEIALRNRETSQGTRDNLPLVVRLSLENLDGSDAGKVAEYSIEGRPGRYTLYHRPDGVTGEPVWDFESLGAALTRIGQIVDGTE